MTKVIDLNEYKSRRNVKRPTNIHGVELTPSQCIYERFKDEKKRLAKLEILSERNKHNQKVLKYYKTTK